MLYGQLRKTEQQFAITQFQSHAQRALKDCSDVVYRQRLSSESLALMISSQFHNSSDWPYVLVPGFEKIIHPLSLAGKTAGMGFAPVLQSGVEQAKWEVCSLFVIGDVYFHPSSLLYHLLSLGFRIRLLRQAHCVGRLS